MKKLVCVLSLLSSASYALSGTMVQTFAGNDVQCNNWGWAKQMLRTYWPDTVCTPLQVKTHAGDVLTVDTTDVCNGDGAAVYTYDEGDTEVKFAGCFK